MNSNIYTPALKDIKTLIESTITTKGNAKKGGYGSIIRTQRPIKILHQAIITDLLNNGVSSNKVKEEKKLSGKLKNKFQDICIYPANVSPHSEILKTSYLVGENDDYGKKYTERIISINVRGQLSSLAKNFDTLYERTFAESLNLHLRCPKMCLGEFYLIPVEEYDQEAIKSKKVVYLRNDNLEKYINAFNYISNRDSTGKDDWKYEKVCLMIVNFRPKTPKLYTSRQELIDDGYLSKDSKVQVGNLSHKGFVSGLVDCHKNRFK